MLLTIGGGSVAYAVDTAGTAHTGSIPSAGPAGASSVGGPGGGGARLQRPGGTSQRGSGTPNGLGLPGGTNGAAPPATPQGGFGGAGTSTNSALAALLRASTTTWAAATTGDQSAAGLELASGGKAVMAIGGWSGSEPTPTLAQFQEYVKAGLIHYYIGGAQSGGFGGAGGGSGTANAIRQWVSAHYAAKTVGGQTVYDLTPAASS